VAVKAATTLTTRVVSMVLRARSRRAALEEIPLDLAAPVTGVIVSEPAATQLESTMSTLNRRNLLKRAAVAPLAGAACRGGSSHAAAQTPVSKFTLSVNLELMFPRQMPYAERIAVVADQGCQAFSFWALKQDQAAAMEGAQRKHGLKCGSITGNGKTGWNTGLTKTGYENAFLDDFKDHLEVAKRFNVKNLVCFLGATQKDLPREVQHRQIIEGLKKVGDIAGKNDVYFCLEPLSIVHHPEMSVHTARHGFRIVQEVNHPHVRLDYDLFHVQLSEGNILNNLREGLRRGWIRFVEIGDPPDRKEPGTGETNYANVFKTLREEGFADFVGLEHGTSLTPEHAIKVVKSLAGA
jgi:hydroxypyruvate isomerase